jgi:excisionase family DNA binding protein
VADGRGTKNLTPVDRRTKAERRINPDRRGSSGVSNRLKRVFNTCEACRYLRVSRPTFFKLVAAGKIRAQKIGKGWKVFETELERFLLNS